MEAQKLRERSPNPELLMITVTTASLRAAKGMPWQSQSSGTQVEQILRMNLFYVLTNLGLGALNASIQGHLRGIQGRENRLTRLHFEMVCRLPLVHFVRQPYAHR